MASFNVSILFETPPAFETLALNSGKIGELNITPDLFSQFMKKGSK